MGGSRRSSSKAFSLKPKHRDLLHTRASPIYIARLRAGLKRVQAFADQHDYSFVCACKDSIVMSELLQKFVQYAYANSVSFYDARHAVLAIQWFWPMMLGQLQTPWKSLESWWLEVPVKNRIPMPVDVLELLFVCALMLACAHASIKRRQWAVLAIVLRIGFFGLLRPGELLCLVVGDVYVCEVLGQYQLVVTIRNPKTRKWLGRRQHVLISDVCTCVWVKWLIQGRSSDEPLWPWGESVARSLFRTLCRSRGLTSSGLTLASLRAGGATHAYQVCQDVSRIQFMGRWASLRTVKIYIQEAMSTYVLSRINIDQFVPLLAASRFVRLPPPTPYLAF